MRIQLLKRMDYRIRPATAPKSLPGLQVTLPHLLPLHLPMNLTRDQTLDRTLALRGGVHTMPLLKLQPRFSILGAQVSTLPPLQLNIAKEQRLLLEHSGVAR